MPTLVVESHDALADVLARVRGAGGTRGVRLEIPPGSALFLTAAEFRALKEAADQAGLRLTIGTADPLRLQLARMLGLATSAEEKPPAPRLAPPPGSGGSRSTTAPPPPSAQRRAPRPAGAPSPPRPGSSAPTGTALQTPTRPAGAPRPTTASPPSTATPPAQAAPKPAAQQPPTTGARSPRPAPPTTPPTATNAAATPSNQPVQPLDRPTARPPSPPAPPPARPSPSPAHTGDHDAPAGPAKAVAPPAARAASPPQAPSTGEPASPPTPGAPLSRTIDLDDDDGTLDAGDHDDRPAPADTATRAAWLGRFRPRSARAWVAAAAAAVALLALLALAAFFLVPGAEVRVTLRQQPRDTALLLDVVAPATEPPPGADVTVEATPRTVSVTFAETIPTTGTRTEPNATAEGQVRFANPNPEPVTVEAGTVLTTEEAVEFAVVDPVEVPAGGTATAAIRARAAGTGGNVETGMVGGQLPSGVYYSNRDGPIGGGTDRTIKVVAPEDLGTLRARVDAALPDLAAAAFADDLPAGVVALPTTFDPGDPRETFDRQPGDDADRLSLTLVRDVTALTYDRDAALGEIRDLAADRLGADAPAGFELAPGSLELADPTPVEEGTERVRFRVEATGEARAVLTEAEREALADDLAGEEPDDAEAVLAAVPEIEAFAVTYSPGWLPDRMPALAGRIEIEADG